MADRIVKTVLEYDVKPAVGSLGQLEGAADKAKIKVKDLEKALKNTSDTAKKAELKTQIVEAKLAVESATKAVDEHRKKMDTTQMSYKQLNNYANKLAKEMNEMTDKSSVAYQNLGKRLGEVTGEITKQKKQNSLLRQEGEALSLTWKDKVMKSFQDFGVVGVASMAAVAMGVKQAFSFITDSFIEFDQAAADTKGELALTEIQIADLKEEAKKTGPQFGKTAKEMLEAFNEVGSGKSELTKTKHGLQDVTEAAVKLSVAGGIGMKESATLLTESLNQYQAEAKESAKYVDIMATGVQVGAAKMDSLTESLKYVGPVAKASNVSFAETNALLQVLAKNGLKGEQAGTSLRGTLLNLANQSDSTINPAIVGVGTAMENLAKKNLSAAKMADLVGTTNVVAALALSSSVPLIKEFTIAIENGGGAQKMFDDKTKSLKFQITQAKAVVLNYAVMFGEKLYPAISGVIRVGLGFINVLMALPKFIYENKGAIAGLLIGVALFNKELILASANSLRLAIAEKGRLIWTQAATIAQGALNVVMKANPIGLLITALVLLAGWLYDLYNKNESFRLGVQGVWNALKVVGSYIADKFSTIISVLSKVFSTLFTVYQSVANYLSGAFSNALTKVGNLFTFIGNKAKSVINVFTELFNFYKNIASQILSFVDKITGGTLSKVVNSVKKLSNDAADAYKKGYVDKVLEQNKKIAEEHKQQLADKKLADAKALADKKAADAKSLADEKASRGASDEDKKKSHDAALERKEDIVKANEEALKKIAELENDAKLEHIRKMDGEAAYEKAKLQLAFEEEKAAIQKSLANKNEKAVQIRLLEAKLDADLEKLEEQNQKTTADIIERYTEATLASKIKKVQSFADKELEAARKHISDAKTLADVERKINEQLKDEIAKIKTEQEEEITKKAEETAKKEAEISKKSLDAEKFILQQETEAVKAYYDWKELDAGKNAKKLLKVQKERLDEELRLQKEKLKLEQQAEELEAKEKIKDKATLEKALLDIQSKYQSLELSESRKVALEKIELEKKVKEEKEKVWRATSSAFSSLLKGDLNSFVEHLSSVNTAQQKGWQKELSGKTEQIAAVAQMAQAAVSFLNDLAQKRAEKAIAEVQREYEFQKATIDKQMSENKDAIAKAEDEKKAIKEASSEKIKSIKEQEEVKIKSLEDFYRSMSSADAKMDLQEQIDLTNQEAEAKIEAAKKAKEEAISNAREAKDEKIIAAEATRDAEINAIKQRNDIDKASKEALIASSKAKAEQEINLAKDEYDTKVKLSKDETEAKIKDATKEKEDKIQLMKQLQTADKEKAKQLIDNAKQEAKEKVAAAEKEKNDKLKIVEQEKAKRVQEKKDLEEKLHEEDKKAKQKEYELKLKAWKAQQKADIASALIGGALAVIKALTAGFPLGLVMAAVTAVMTGVQIAKIKKQAPPEMPTFESGGLAVGPAHGKIYGQGGIGMVSKRTKREFAEFEGGEWIVDKENTAQNLPILQHMKANKMKGKVVPLGFANGGIIDNIPWGKPMYQYGGRVIRMYDEGGEIPSPESVSSQSAAASAAEGGESANADRDMAKKQAEEQLENQKNQLIELKKIGEKLDKIDDNTSKNIGATNGVAQAVRDNNTNSKFDSLIGSISKFGGKAA